jgi:hypothetical protein
MAGCLAEDELLELARGERSLGAAPALESHLADCSSCSALLAKLIGDTPEHAERRDLAGRRLGPYRLDALIGAGAMGQVYRGFDLRLRREVAVKVLPADFAEPERVRRLEAEGRAAAAVAHPNVVTVYDAGTEGGVPYVVSELIEGETLRSLIDRGPIPRGTALSLGLQLARGLAAAHAKAVVHRDLKPANLVVTGGGTLKILDFGLARVLGGGVEPDATAPGTLLGTSGYLAPEQARGEPADARSDIFSVGAILYELLSGGRAFGGATFAERLSGVLRDTPPPLDDPASPAVLRCLEKDPRRRFESANDLAWVLEGLLGPDAPPRPPPGQPARVSRRAFALGTAAAGLAGAVLGRWLLPPRPTARPEFHQLTFRQGRVASARFTREGGSVLHSAAWDGLPLATYTARLGGGGTRPLDLPPGQLLAVSSRGELALSLGHCFVEGFHQRGDLALAPLEGGGQPRRLGLEVQDADFAPGGAELAVVRAHGNQFRLEFPIGHVLLEGGWLSHPRVSPDGRDVACLMHDGPMDDRGDVVLVPRAGGAPRTIAEGWSSIDGLAWTPDGGALWVSASREGGNNQVRSLDLRGRELVRVSTAGRLRLYDVSPEGRLAVAHTSGRLRMMVQAPGAAEETDLSLSDVSIVADLSADGRSVVFAEFGDVDTANGTYLRPTVGGAALRLGDGWPMDLADDGRGVLALSYGDGRPLVLPTSAGQPRPLPPIPLAGVRWARWCAGDRVLLGGATAGRPPRLWTLEGQRALTPVTEEGVFGRPSVSPDGTKVAFVHGERLLVVSVAMAGSPVVVPGEFRDERVCGWSVGGAGVLLRTTSPPIAIRRVDLTTGASVRLFELDPPRVGRRGVYEVVVSESGAYAYSFGQEQSRLYLMSLARAERPTTRAP